VNDFIDLNALCGQVPNMLIMIGRASFAGIDHQFDDRIFACTC
jgi:hypothetical protein